jgi:hypothetical protein
MRRGSSVKDQDRHQPTRGVRRGSRIDHHPRPDRVCEWSVTVVAWREHLVNPLQLQHEITGSNRELVAEGLP